MVECDWQIALNLISSSELCSVRFNLIVNNIAQQGRLKSATLATLAADDPVAGNHGGRPPDSGMCVDVPVSLERPGSPIAVDLQPSIKKGRSLVSPVSDVLMKEGVLPHSRNLGGLPLTESGDRQDIEYEGLPEICFKCGKYGHAKDVYGITSPATSVAEDNALRNLDELYGPWMQVSNRKRRNGQSRKDLDNGSKDKAKSVNSGSRFSALAIAQDPDIIVDKLTPVQQIREMESATVTVGGSLAMQTRILNASKGVRGEYNDGTFGGDMDIQNRDSHSSFKEQLAERTRKNTEGESGSQGTRVASQERVAAAKSLLNTEKHVVVQKKRDVQNGSPPTLEVGLWNLIEELHNAENLEASRLGASIFEGVKDGDNVSWIHNSTFVQTPGTNMLL
ncbi:hypothetical protein V6N13_006182 [Hibiscus sabdariffa]